MAMTTQRIAESVAGAAGRPDAGPVRFLRMKLEDEVQKRTGHRPSKSTTERWFRRGIRGQRLGIIRVGGRILIDAGELDRFLAAVNGEAAA